MRVRFPFLVIGLFFSGALLVGCARQTPSPPPVVQPSDCRVKTGGTVTFSLDGQIPANTTIRWSASAGKITWSGQGLVATFIAPQTPGDVVITVSFFTTSTPPVESNRTCTVVAAGETEDPDDNGTTELPPSPLTADGPTVVISEVMGNPCGPMENKKWNQYVELYNYGDEAVDVGGWWLYDEGEHGTPDQLVAWETRIPVPPGESLVTNSTILPPHGFAIILSPLYLQGPEPYHMPYTFPSGTVILTVGGDKSLGDDVYYIIADQPDFGVRDTLTLYVGSSTTIERIVDTYGTPRTAGIIHPRDLNDDSEDAIPLYLRDCEAAERIDPHLPDNEFNWSAVPNGTPGDGAY